MLAPILALSILQGALPSPRAQVQPRDTSDATMIVLDCGIANMMLDGCMVVGDVSADRTAAALNMASRLKVPDPVLESGVDHVRLRLKLPAAEAGGATQPEQTGINP